MTGLCTFLVVEYGQWRPPDTWRVGVSVGYTHTLSVRFRFAYHDVEATYLAGASFVW